MKMKKLLSFILSISILFSFITIIVNGETGEEILILSNTCSAKYPENIKFYSNIKASLNSTNWLEFDIDIQDGGNYEIYTNASNISEVNASVSVNNNAVISSTIVSNCSDWSVYSDYLLGTSVLPQGKQKIKFCVLSGGLSLISLKLKRVVPNEVIKLEAETPTSYSETSMTDNSSYKKYARSSASNGYVVGINGSQWAEWNVDFAQEGMYSINICGSSVSTNTASVSIDGVYAVYNKSLSTTGTLEFNDASILDRVCEKVYISSGTHNIKFIKGAGGYTMDYISVEYVKPVGQDIELDSYQFSDIYGSSVISYSQNTYVSFTGGYITYDVNVPASGIYRFYLVSSNSPYTSLGTNISVTIDGGDTINMSAVEISNGWSDYRESYIGSVYLKQGMRSIKLQKSGADLSLKAIKFNFADNEQCIEATKYSNVYSKSSFNILNDSVVVGENNSISYNVPIAEDAYYKISLYALNTEHNDTVINLSIQDENVKKYIRRNNDYSYYGITAPLKTGNYQLKINVCSNELNFKNIKIEKIEYLNETELLEKISNYGVEKTLTDNGDYFGIDLEQDTQELFCANEIFDDLKCDYHSIISVENDYTNVLVSHIKNPKICADDDNENPITDIINGNMVIKCDIVAYSQPVDALFAIYSDGKLKNISISENVTSNAVFNISNFRKEDNHKYQCKLYCWDSIKNMTPYRETSNYVYVSTDGDDSFNGTTEQPVATIQKAVDIASKRSAYITDDINVFVSSGEYSITSPIEISTDNQHKNNKKIIINGSNDTVINGGTKIDNSTWTKYYDFGDGRVIYKAYIDDVPDIRQLWVNGQKAERAKSPSKCKVIGFYPATATNISESAGIIATVEASSAIAVSDNSDMELVFNSMWANQRIPIKNITNNNDGTFTFEMESEAWKRLLNCSYNKFDTTQKRISGNIEYANMYDYFYLENSLHLLDSKGEFWYRKPSEKLNRGVIYYMPKDNEDLLNSECVVGISEGLFNICGTDKDNRVSNIELNNLIFEYGTWLKPNNDGIQVNQADSLNDGQQTTLSNGGNKMFAQLNIKWASDISINNCKFNHIGSSAIDVAEGNKNCEISDNTFNDLSAGAVMIGSWEHREDASEKLCSNILIDNNNISNSSNEYSGSPAITAYFVHNVDILHNSIYNIGYSGISSGWGWGSYDVTKNVNIRNNRIERSMTILDDGAPIYTLGQMRNSYISDNYIDTSLDSTDFCQGIYLDQGSSYLTIENNVINNCKYCLFANIKTHDNTFGTNYTDYKKYLVREYDEKNDSYKKIYPKLEYSTAMKALSIINNSGVCKKGD